MGAVYFYHLTHQSVSQALPQLAEKGVGVGWRIAIRATNDVDISELDDALWTFKEDSFLPHTVDGGAGHEHCPIILGNSPDCGAEGFDFLMSVGGAEVTAEEIFTLKRTAILFDGNNQVSLENARQQWKLLSDAGCQAQYWSQDSGKWQMKAQKNAP